MNTENTSEWGSRTDIHVLALIAATALGVYLCYRMALPFVPALTWALALAVAFMPLHRWLESTVQHSNLAASVSVLVIGLIVIVPATFVGQRLVSEAVTGADTISTREAIGVLLTFYLLFYFLRDQREVLMSLRALSPLSQGPRPARPSPVPTAKERADPATRTSVHPSALYGGDDQRSRCWAPFSSGFQRPSSWRWMAVGDGPGILATPRTTTPPALTPA